MQVELIETKRLKGERIDKSHWQFWLEMGLNPKVMATLGGTWNKEKAEKIMDLNCEEWDCHGHGQWIFFDKTTGKFVGRGGIRKVVVNGDREVELGYALMPEFWGYNEPVQT